METDYKIARFEEQPDGSVHLTVRFYEGQTSTEDEYDAETGTLKPVTRYRRTALIGEHEYKFADAEAVTIRT